MTRTQYGIIGVLASIIVVGIFLLFAISPEKSAQELAENSQLLITFQNELTRGGVERIGQPIEGFDAQILMQAFPGLIEKDFNKVKSLEGIYTYEDTKLVYERTGGQPVTSAEQTISPEGYGMLLNNLSNRFETTLHDESDIEKILDKLSEADPVLKGFIYEDYSIWLEEGWYEHKTANSIFFTHEETFGISNNTDGFAVGPWIQINVEQLDNESGSATSLKEWFKRNQWVEENESLLSKEEVIVNGIQMTRIVIEAFGADGEVLHYVTLPDPGRIITLSHYPYRAGSTDTQDFESIITTFQPNFVVVKNDTIRISGHVLLGPQCPVMREEFECPDKGYQTEILVKENKVTEVELFRIPTNAAGQFSAQLKVGNYYIEARGGTPFPVCSGQNILVAPEKNEFITLNCDSGIR